MNNISGNRQDFSTMKEDIERYYPVKVGLRLSYWVGYTGGGGESAILAFIFGAIAGGFLSEIGKDLWMKAKELCKGIYDSHKNHHDNSECAIIVEFEYKGYQITAVLEVDKKTRDKLEAVYQGYPLQYFWEGLPIQLDTLMKIVNESGADIRDMSSFGLSLDTEKPMWLLTKYKKKMDVSKYIDDPTNKKSKS